MARNLSDLRFGIKRDDGYISSIWRLWTTKQGDVYLTSKAIGGVHKYSFHQSGICKSALTKEYFENHKNTQNQNDDKAFFKWKRNPTPQIGDNVVRVGWFAFPTDYLSKEFQPERKKVNWIDAAPTGGATYIELVYTSKSESEVKQLLNNGDRKLVFYTQLSKNESFLVMYYHSDWENKYITSPTSEGSIFSDLIFAAEDKEETGRPIRIKLAYPPKDGDALLLQELGGYRI